MCISLSTNCHHIPNQAPRVTSIRNSWPYIAHVNSISFGRTVVVVVVAAVVDVAAVVEVATVEEVAAVEAIPAIDVEAVVIVVQAVLVVTA